jgi:PAS domain S-box-containing protein
LHVFLSQTDEGLAIFFHEHREPLHPQHTLSQNDQMYRDLLESFADDVTIVTPEGLVLDINQRPLADAHLRREVVVGKPLTDLPAWSSDPAVQEQLRAAIARASRGETVRFEARIHPRTDLDLDVSMTITSHRDASQQVEYLICAGRDITERKHAEDELRTLVDAIPHFIWIFRPDGSAEYHNQQLCDYTNVTPEQLQGSGWPQCLHPDDRRRVFDAWQTAVCTKTPYEVELRIQHGSTGDYRWFLARAMPVRDEANQIVRWFGTCTDIHDKKQAEEELRVLIDAIPQFVGMMSPDGSFDYANQRWCDYTGMTSEQTQGDGWLQASHPDDSQHILTAWRHACASGELFEIEHRFKDGQTGSYRWFLARAMPMRDDTGQIVRWFGTCTDIHDKKQAEERIKTSEQNWRVLAETVPHLVWTTRPDNRIDYVNQRYCDLTQANFEQLRDYGWRQMVHPEDLERMLAIRQHSLETGELYENEYRLRDGRAGGYRWFLVRALPVRDETGQIIKWFGTGTDIEEKKQAEQKIKESEQNLHVLAETVPQLVWTTRPDGLHEYANQRWCDYTGLTNEHMQSNRWAPLQCIHPADREGTRTLWQHALDTGAMYEHEERFRNSQTGAYRWFLARAMPVRDETGQIVKWFGTATDIDEQKRTEVALRQS